jgi:hypothetical protein
LKSAGDYLNAEGVPFAVVGALALHTYGYSRATNDVEELILLAGDRGSA